MRRLKAIACQLVAGFLPVLLVPANVLDALRQCHEAAVNVAGFAQLGA